MPAWQTLDTGLQEHLPAALLFELLSQNEHCGIVHDARLSARRFLPTAGLVTISLVNV